MIDFPQILRMVHQALYTTPTYVIISFAIINREFNRVKLIVHVNQSEYYTSSPNCILNVDCITIYTDL